MRWTVFPLHPETPDDGRTLVDLFAGRLDVPKAMEELQSIAANLELPFGHRTHTYNSRRAQELGKWAEKQGRGDDFRAAVYRAYFADGKNISDPDVLLSVCQHLGLPLLPAQDVLEQRLCAGEVDADWQRAAQVGISSVPSHLYRNQLLTGFSSVEALEELISPSSS